VRGRERESHHKQIDTSYPSARTVERERERERERETIERETIERPTTVSKETYYGVKRELLQCQKRPTTVSKETYYN